MNVIRAIIVKEMTEILRNRTLVLTTLLPGLIFLLIPLLMGVRGGRINTRAAGPGQMAELLVRMSPELTGLPEASHECVARRRDRVNGR